MRSAALRLWRSLLARFDQRSARPDLIAAILALAGGAAWEYIGSRPARACPSADLRLVATSSMSNELKSHPDPSQWDEYVDFESTAWPKKERRKYWIIPSVCFNCESACGILAYLDQESLDVRKIEGNPLHPGSRGRTCAKVVVAPNQLDDPDRILYPIRRTGAVAKVAGNA